MLDKSVAYFDVIMCLPAGSRAPAPPALPPGYAYRLYRPGDAADWCAVEASVGEFVGESQAAEYFSREFAPYPDALAARMAFVMDAEGKTVATATAWWKQDEARGRLNMLHWVAVRPEAQGRGLGRAVTCKALSLFTQAEQKGDIWLTTQTWSHVAIDLYLKLGFRAHKTACVARHKNGFDGAARVLAPVMRPKSYARMMITAIP